MKKIKMGIVLIALLLSTAAGQALHPDTAAGQALQPGIPNLPPEWQVTASALADVTGDGAAEWLLVVWRPWRDWPIQRWSAVPSPIAGFHDASGHSCHLIVLDPGDGSEIWAGSALPVPLLGLAAADVDGDGVDDLLTVEGEYAAGRDGAGTRVDVWQWNGFGFSMLWRSPPGQFDPACLAEAGRCGIQQAVQTTGF